MLTWERETGGFSLAGNGRGVEPPAELMIQLSMLQAQEIDRRDRVAQAEQRTVNLYLNDEAARTKRRIVCRQHSDASTLNFRDAKALAYPSSLCIISLADNVEQIIGVA